MKNKVIGLLTSSFLVVSAFAISGPKVEAQAVTKKITQTFANTLEKGTLPSANGSIYTSYGSLKSTAPASNFNTVSGTYIDSKNDIYYFKRDKVFYIPAGSKVNMIQRTYDFKLSKNSLNKYLGDRVPVMFKNKPVKSYYLYKTGNYYTLFNFERFESEGVDRTVVLIGTKEAMEKELTRKIKE